ncbi:MAG TPA: signal peptidase II [Casimicrobiaceae bacterium]|nr:signal peptidase II [Casimicrobiaceae bacterium]
MSAARSQPVAARGWWRWLAVAAVVVIADQLSKLVVLSSLPVGASYPVTSFLSIILTFNAGAAFSFLGDAAGWQRYLFSAFAVGAAILIVWLLRRGGDRLYCCGLALILGGALGNLWDRATIGKVVDFLLFHDFLPVRPAVVAWLDPFPAFNIADSAITVGAALLILDSLRQRHHGQGEARQT